jgi:catechol 2,3-dioxygenase-like lactoylglutathione lyase family enzyme
MTTEPIELLDRFTVRYLVDDVQASTDFYTKHFGFTVDLDAAPAFVQVSRGHLKLQLSGPTSSAGVPLPDGRVPEPGGWNRIQLAAADIYAAVEHLRAAGVRFRTDVIQGKGGRQVLFDDPAGNPVTLFEPPPGH